MHQDLKLHPDSRCDAVAAIAVEVSRPGSGQLRLTYLVTGEIEALSLPPLTVPARADELWQHTCFEAFVRAGPDSAYCEFNFAPSTQWAAYDFEGYRSGMTAAEIPAPSIETKTGAGRYELTATVDLPLQGTWRLGLSAVIEEASGRKSYWALAHPPGKPDFHHSDCFALEVPAA